MNYTLVRNCMHSLFCLVLLSGMQAYANESINRSQLPGLFEVAGVPAGDVLNVRAAPDGESEDLGDFKNGDRVEVTALDETGHWVQILYFEGDGWLAARYLMKVELKENPQNRLAYPLNCGGTEPFWSFIIGDKGVTEWSGIDIDSRSDPIEWAIRSRSLGSQAYAMSSGPFTAIIHRRQCSDGMSDRSYGWNIDLVREDEGAAQHFAGCCRWQP